MPLLVHTRPPTAQVLERETAKQLELLKKFEAERGMGDARRKR